MTTLGPINVGRPRRAAGRVDIERHDDPTAKHIIAESREHDESSRESE